MANYYTYKESLGNSGAYQVSGKPFASGGHSVAAISNTTIQFPSVTQWVQISNCGSNDLKIAFTATSLTRGDYFFILPAGAVSPVFDVKVTEISLRGSGGTADPVSVTAGLTDVSTRAIVNNWSGSVGV